MREAGIKIVPPDINKSDYTFIPDANNNTIIYGLKGINKIGDSLVDEIIANRPYDSLENLINKVKLNKTQIISLIKAGAFDNFGDRKIIMKNYIISIAGLKKDLNLRNLQMLIEKNFLPDTLDLEKRIFNFNKYIKKNCVNGTNYQLSDYPLDFYKEYFDEDILNYDSNGQYGLLSINTWTKIYNKNMDTVRNYIKNNKISLLNQVNNNLIAELDEKYCQGNLSHWEMESISYYSHPHELSYIQNPIWVDFNSLSAEPEIEYTFTTKDGKEVPIFKIQRIAGTVLDKDKIKKTITLLTTTGVVTVKIFGDAFAKYDKQLSEIGADGKKHIIEKSFIGRGKMIIVTGIRRGDNFMAKKYKNTPYHLIEQIINIDDNTGDYTTIIRE